MKTIKRICMIGAGRLGAPIAATLAARGFQVVAADTDPVKVDLLNAGRPPVFETDLARMLTAAKSRLTATTDVAEAVADADATFILVPTPSDTNGHFSLRHVLPVVAQVGRAIARKRTFHLVSLVSTVMPGATGGPVLEALEQASGRRAGRDFGLCYSPEFVALGSVVRNTLNPDFILIGAEDASSGDLMGSVYDRLCKNSPPQARMNYVNAELAKIAVNAFVTTKITFANMLANVCDKLPGADVDRVTAALGLDGRIGGQYLSGGVGYGGPCFPRDNVALAAAARAAGASAQLVESVDACNRKQTSQLVEQVRCHLRPADVVGILGLSYKPNSDVVEASQGLLLAEALRRDGIEVTAYDPAAMDNVRASAGQSIRLCRTLDDCVAASDVIVIATAWPQFKRLDAARLHRPGAPRTLIDPWRMLGGRDLGSAVRHVQSGVGPKTAGKAPQKALQGAA